MDKLELILAEDERTGSPEPDAGHDFALPECQRESDESLHEWRTRVLGGIREHLESGEVYRLAPTDLGFGLERIVKEMAQPERGQKDRRLARAGRRSRRRR